MSQDIQFLLIQDGVLDSSPIADKLCWKWLDQTKPFEVAIGHTNEFSSKEVVGVVARANPGDNPFCWRISSLIDGYNRLVGCAGSIAGLIRTRLRVYQARKYFDDLCNLPQMIEIEGSNAW